MALKLFLSVAFGLTATVQPTTYFNREIEDICFFEVNTKYISSKDTSVAANDALGHFYDVDLMDRTGYVANFFGTDIRYFRFFDAGYAECDDAAPITTTVAATGDILTPDPGTDIAFKNQQCLVVPYLTTTACTRCIYSDSDTRYLMAVRVVNNTQPQHQIDLERASAEVNRAKNQYRGKFTAKAGIFATWFLEDGTGHNEFQAIVVVGDAGAGALETYVIFVFDTLKLQVQAAGIKGFVNGLYSGPPNAVFAQVCHEVGAIGVIVDDKLGTNSNMKCGNPGVYVLPVSGTTCDENDICSTTTTNPNCNATVIPIDSCTETFYCYDNGQIELHLKFDEPAWPLLQALDYEKFTTNEEQDLLSEDVAGSELCIMNFTDYDTEGSVGHYIINVPKVEPVKRCGIVYTAATNSVKFAYKLWDGTSNSMMVDRYGQLVLKGECFADDLKQSVSVTIGHNHVTPVTEIIRGPRELYCNIVDRPYFDNHQVLTRAKIGRNFWVLCVFDPFTPFNLWTDPYGIYVIDGWAANNADFEHNTVADPWKRSQKFISNGCGVDKATGALEAIWLENTVNSKSFEADPNYHTYPTGTNPDGSPWYLIAGYINSNKWNKVDGTGAPVHKMWFKFTVGFCTRDDDLPTCLDSCSSDPSRRRKRSVNNEDEIKTLYTSLEFEYDDEEPSGGATEKFQGVEHESCTSFQTAVTTMAVLLAMLVIAVILCILIMLKWVNMKNKSKKASNIKKLSS